MRTKRKLYELRRSRYLVDTAIPASHSLGLRSITSDFLGFSIPSFDIPLLGDVFHYIRSLNKLDSGNCDFDQLKILQRFA